MTTPPDDNLDPLVVIAYMKATPGKEDELRAALTALVEPTRAEEGNVTYQLNEVIDEPGRFFFYENWASPALLEQHLAAPHIAELLAKAPEMLDESGLTVHQLRRLA